MIDSRCARNRLVDRFRRSVLGFHVFKSTQRARLPGLERFLWCRGGSNFLSDGREL